jgi:YbgC/YbaW family acyl-CoA thioester hydrolase
VPLVYTATVAVRHHELDAWGRVHPGAHLRTVAEVAVQASTAAGFGPAWYDALGAHWIVRRTLARFHRPVGRDAVSEVKTWVADFRRVRSRRCYEIRVGGVLAVEAESDWVLVDVVTGRPRRIPADVERTFGAPSGAASARRDDWDETLPPVTPLRTAAAVRFTDLDSLGHVNNAAYMDVFVEAALGPLAHAGWGVERLGARGLAPFVAACDVEYRDAVVWGDALEITTWMAPVPRGFEVVQHLGPAGTDAASVRARTRWEWHALASGEPMDAPAELARALDGLAAA